MLVLDQYTFLSITLLTTLRINHYHSKLNNDIYLTVKKKNYEKIQIHALKKYLIW